MTKGARAVLHSKTLRWLVVSSQAESAGRTRRLQMSVDGGSLVLVTGASGYIGGRLLKALETAGRPVCCLTPRPDFLRSRVAPSTEGVKADCLEPSSDPAAMGGVHTAYAYSPSPKPMNTLHRAFPLTNLPRVLPTWNSRSPSKTRSTQPERAMAFPGIRGEPATIKQKRAFRRT